MDRVRSKDGTWIAYEKSGSGSPLVLVHGTTADHTRWAPILPRLEKAHTVYAVDRRGRGGSGDGEPYAIEREFEDVAAVVDSIPEPVNLLGHSYGAICSLEAALRTRNLRRLILYEPPIPVGVPGVYPSDVVAEVRNRLAEGDRDGAVTLFLSRIARVPQSELDLLKSVPAWKGRVAAAHTVLREIDAGDKLYKFEPRRFRSVKVPVLLLVGGDSPEFLKVPVDELHRILPNSRLVVMPGQQHVAINTAPDLFLREVLSFLAEPESQPAEAILHP